MCRCWSPPIGTVLTVWCCFEASAGRRRMCLCCGVAVAVLSTKIAPVRTTKNFSSSRTRAIDQPTDGVPSFDDGEEGKDRPGRRECSLAYTLLNRAMDEDEAPQDGMSFVFLSFRDSPHRFSRAGGGRGASYHHIACIVRQVHGQQALSRDCVFYLYIFLPYKAKTRRAYYCLCIFYLFCHWCV